MFQLTIWPFDLRLINHMTSSHPHPHSITLMIHNNRSRPTRLTHNGTRFLHQLRVITCHGPFAHAYQSFIQTTSNWGSWATCPDCTLSAYQSFLTGSSRGQLPKLRVIIGHGPLAKPIMALVSTPITCNHRSRPVCPHIQLHVPTLGYPNYIQLGSWAAVGSSISFDRPRPHSTTVVLHNNGTRIPNS